MNALERVLNVVVLFGTGLLAGVLFAVAVSVAPALLAMPPDRYVWAHKLLGRNYDRIMPVVNVVSVISAVLLATRSRDLAHATPYIAAAVCLVGVAVVSQTQNVPINIKVKRLVPEDLGPDWEDQRVTWRNWHLVRTVLALSGSLFAAIAVVAR